MANDITVINYSTSKDKIGNYNELPQEVKSEIDKADNIFVEGFRGLLGHKNKIAIWSAGGHWEKEKWLGDDKYEAIPQDKQKFIIETFGSKTIQWNNNNGIKVKSSTEELAYKLLKSGKSMEEVEKILAEDYKHLDQYPYDKVDKNILNKMIEHIKLWLKEGKDKEGNTVDDLGEAITLAMSWFYHSLPKTDRDKYPNLNMAYRDLLIEEFNKQGYAWPKDILPSKQMTLFEGSKKVKASTMYRKENGEKVRVRTTRDGRFQVYDRHDNYWYSADEDDFTLFPDDKEKVEGAKKKNRISYEEWFESVAQELDNIGIDPDNYIDDLTDWHESGATTEQAFQNVCDMEGVNDAGDIEGAKNDVYTYYTDAGHGWLEVEKKELIELGIDNIISYHSFEKGGLVYLEEDVDVGVFVVAYKNKYGVSPQHKDVYEERSSIRNYDHYRHPDFSYDKQKDYFKKMEQDKIEGAKKIKANESGNDEVLELSKKNPSLKDKFVTSDEAPEFKGHKYTITTELPRRGIEEWKVRNIVEGEDVFKGKIIIEKQMGSLSAILPSHIKTVAVLKKEKIASAKKVNADEDDFTLFPDDKDKVESAKKVKADGKEEESMFPWGDYGDDEKFEEYWSEKHRGEVSDDFVEYFYAGDYKKAYDDLVRQMSDAEFKEAMEFIIRMNS